MSPALIYCYDAYCQWCYGFSPIMQQVARTFGDMLPVEVLSGGMILAKPPRPLSVTADFLKQNALQVEKTTGVRFGSDWRWHVNHPEESDWFPDSEKPAIALSIFKDYLPELQLHFATDLLYSLHFEGRDLCDDEAYRHLLRRYHIPAEEFYERLHSEEYKKLAHDDFGTVSRLKVTGFPALFVQESENRVHLITSGFAEFDVLQSRIEAILTGSS